MVHPRTALTLAAITVFPTFIIFSSNNLFGAKDGALLHVVTKANGTSIEHANNSWKISKNTETKNLQLSAGESYTPTFTIQVTKNIASTTNTQSAQGEICIKNQGKQPTADLQITSTVQYKEQKGNFQNLDGATQILNPEQINSDAKSCFPLKIDFTQPASAKHFRVKTEATVTNPAKRNKHKAGGYDTDSFKLEKSTTTISETATIQDVITCPTDYNCTSTDSGPWQVSGDQTISYSTEIKNISADCNTPASFTNEAKLIDDNKNTATSTTSIPINTGSC